MTGTTVFVPYDWDDCDMLYKTDDARLFVIRFV